MNIIISSIFRYIADALYNASIVIGITYNEINIIVYYLLIPLTWTIMLDFWLGTPITTYALIFMWMGIKIGTWGRFKEWSDRAFMRSVGFLNYFNQWGGNYILNSVIICVIVPVFIYMSLALLLIF